MLKFDINSVSNFTRLDRYTTYKCKVFSNLFALSAERGFSSKSFVERVMTSSKISSLVNIDERTEWCDEYFLLDSLNRIEHFRKGTVIDDIWALKWLGYLYKYWMSTRGIKSEDAYKLYSYDRFMVCYGFHHTQDWDFVIDDILKSQNSYIV